MRDVGYTKTVVATLKNQYFSGKGFDGSHLLLALTFKTELSLFCGYRSRMRSPVRVSIFCSGYRFFDRALSARIDRRFWLF